MGAGERHRPLAAGLGLPATGGLVLRPPDRGRRGLPSGRGGRGPVGPLPCPLPAPDAAPRPPAPRLRPTHAGTGFGRRRSLGSRSPPGRPPCPGGADLPWL